MEETTLTPREEMGQALADPVEAARGWADCVVSRLDFTHHREQAQGHHPSLVGLP